ncbi:metallophosphoesterase [Pseudaminobacter soli (ex Li et al. 2025)]|uniref:Serine/threonine protein phosphatase n=1 Tax=Pseudaminobacter soli (ex Li et al. 2025) TaxID=1295366 RepID=A0A2P7SGK7_9HYPH|nr:metallophosphoesterase [Mesorhizobium soli]PSJ61629.1 serine/threonine protein phosphatase [Mesorhizobium soli]
MKTFAGLFGLDKGFGRARRARLQLDISDSAVYAIGDIHGCLDELLMLEQEIFADAGPLPGRKLIVMLGDYIDRGPAPREVIEHLMTPPPPDFERICLTGNHEVALLDYLDGRLPLLDWMPMGADATLQSYGIDHDRLGHIYQSPRHVDEIIRSAIPAAHVAFLRSLPIMVEAERYVFVHAGIRPELELDQQSDDDLIYIRSAFFDSPHPLKKYVVHGHTPVTEASLQGGRINVDTGCFYSGRLTALRIFRNKGRYLSNKT